MTLKIGDQNPNPAFIFFNFHGKNIIAISEKKGFEFNREGYPDFEAEDFAREFIRILEHNFKITFCKRDKDENEKMD
jgi:hypothetical protein